MHKVHYSRKYMWLLVKTSFPRSAVTRDVCKYRRTDRSLGAVAGRLAVSSVGALHITRQARRDRSLGAVAGRLAVSSVGALHITRQARRDPAWHALNDAIRLASCSSTHDLRTLTKMRIELPEYAPAVARSEVT